VDKKELEDMAKPELEHVVPDEATGGRDNKAGKV
jgi:hypothetical protein